MPHPRSAVRRALLVHLATSVVVLVLAGIGAAVLVGTVVSWEVRDDAVAESSHVTHGVFAPLVDARLRAGDPAAVARLDRAVTARTRASSILRVKVWDARGTILYSDAPRLVGKRFPLDPDDREVLRDQGTDANVSDLSRPENIYERGFGPVIEVYVGARDATGTPVLVETYFSATNLHQREVSLETRVTSVAVLALVFLALLLVPLSLRLARRVERYERERLAMVRLAMDASADERRRLARELHDGVVQDLSGTRYVLASVEKQLTERRLPELKNTVRIALDVILVQIEALRSLTSTLFSATPGGTDVTEVLAGLARDAEARGLRVRLEIGPLPPLPATVAEALTQVARESLRNVVSHAQASHATVSLSARGADEVTLVVRDDGRGFRPGQAATPLGHLGLQLLDASAQRARGTVRVASAPGHGTTVTLVIPIRHDDAPDTELPRPAGPVDERPLDERELAPPVAWRQ
jgi:two-component system, NarL family, sensor kinase